MLIDLQPPFNSRWSKGYLQIHSDGRKNVHLYNSNKDRTTISYARYLMGVYLGEEVSDHLEVDHINDDKTDDRIENYQLLTPEQNRLKKEWLYTVTVLKWHILPCTFCNYMFYITDRDLRFRNIETICCSRNCADSLKAIKPNTPREIKVDVDLIKHLRALGLSSYKIAEQTGYARNTIMKHW